MFASLKKNNEELNEMVSKAMIGIFKNKDEDYTTIPLISKSQSAKYLSQNDLRIKEEIEDSKLIPTIKEISYLFDKLATDRLDKAPLL